MLKDVEYTKNFGGIFDQNEFIRICRMYNLKPSDCVFQIERYKKGIYLVNGLSFEDQVRERLKGFHREMGFFIEEGLTDYGVCDSVGQVLKRYPFEQSKRNFVIAFTWIDKEESKGWRWHKWGEYIGTHVPQCEYLGEEQGIDGVYCFHAYEIL